MASSTSSCSIVCPVCNDEGPTLPANSSVPLSNRSTSECSTPITIEPSATSDGASEPPTTDAASTYNEEVFQQEIAKMFIIDGLPFRMVEGEVFKKVFRVLEPRFQVPSVITVARDCLQIYLKEKEKLKDILVSNHPRVCLTTATWTTAQNINYMCLTAHYIDSDWRLQRKILNFCQVANFEGETIGKAIETCLLLWGIDRVFAATIDNASSNDSAIAYLSKIVNNWNGTIMKGKFMHMRCFTDRLNLIAIEGLKDYNESINRIRNVVRFVNSTSLRSQKFKACVEKEKITSNKVVRMDDMTRWNSTYLMLDAAEKLQKAFERLEVEDAEYVREFCFGEKNGAPSSTDWGHARALVKFLSLLYDATLKLSGSLIVAPDIFLWHWCYIHESCKIWSGSKDPFLKVMGENMIKRRDKYLGNYETFNPCLFVAVLLDPRHKERLVEFSFKFIYGENMASELTNKVRSTLNELYDEYKLLYAESAESPDEMEVDSARVTLNALYRCYLKETGGVECKTEVDDYLMASHENHHDSSFDILGWWKTNSSKYKILSYIARDVLALPFSTVASDLAFSTSGHVLDPFRSSLPSRTVEALVCTRNWLNSSVETDLPDMVGEIEEIESEILGAFPEVAFGDN